MSLQELLGQELYDQVIEKAGDKKIAVVNDGNWFPKTKFDQVNDDNKDLKQQLKDRDDQLDELSKKAKGNEDLQAEIDRLQEENNNTKNEYEQQLQEKTFNYELEKALSAQKAKNPKAVKALLNTEAIKLDGDKLLGLEEQLTELKENEGYLFGEDQPGLGGRTPHPGKGGQGTGVTKEQFNQMGYQERVELYQEDPDTYQKLTNE